MVKQKKEIKPLIVYMDTCVLLDNILYRQGFTEVNGNRKFDIGSIIPNKAEILFTEIHTIEITEKLKDAELSRKAIDSGYSYFELRKDRLEEFELSTETFERINDTIEKHIVRLPAIVGPKSSGLTSKDINNLLQICNKYSIFIIDAIHFLIADRENCNIFISSDKNFRKAIKQLLVDSDSIDSMKILSPQEFKNTLLKSLVS